MVVAGVHNNTVCYGRRHVTVEMWNDKRPIFKSGP